MIKFQPTLVSHSVLRAYGIEHPIGDPFGGAAYGEKNKGGSLGGGLSGLASILGGVAVIASGGTLAPLMGGLMIAGGAMTSIGAVTGNNTLMNIGGITSTVGGIGAVGAGVYDNWDKIASFLSSDIAASGTTGAEVSGNAVTTTGQAAGANVPTIGDVPNTGTLAVQETPASFQPTSASFQGGSFTDQMAGELNNQILASQQPVANSVNTAMSNPSNWMASTQGVVDSGGVAAGLSDAGTGFGTAQPFTGTPTAFPGSGASFGSTGAATIGDSGGSFIGSIQDGSNQGLLYSVGNFIEKNPLASMMGMQALSGLAQGASPKSQAEGDYLNAMAQLKQAEADYINAAKSDETAANTEYLRAKAQEFEKTKAYAEEKRRLYNESIQNLQMPTNLVDYSSALFNRGGAINQGIINGARA